VGPHPAPGRLGRPDLERPAHEQLLQTYGTDYASVNHRRIGEGDLQAFFGAAPLQRATFPYRQSLDLAGVVLELLKLDD
jgi:hypothetical protein